VQIFDSSDQLRLITSKKLIALQLRRTYKANRKVQKFWNKIKLEDNSIGYFFSNKNIKQ
jgi:hypothetical protein